MTIDEAIEVLSYISYGDTLTVKYDIDNALKLGIEALKRIKLLRGNLSYPHEKPLYGETEEE